MAPLKAALKGNKAFKGNLVLRFWQIKAVLVMIGIGSIFRYWLPSKYAGWLVRNDYLVKINLSLLVIRNRYCSPL
jgi:hypothetical protein